MSRLPLIEIRAIRVPLIEIRVPVRSAVPFVEIRNPRPT